MKILKEMTVQDVFRKCDLAKTYDIWADKYADENELQDTADITAFGRVSAFIENLLSIKPRPSHDVILAFMETELGKPIATTLMFKKKNFRPLMRSVRGLKFPSYSESDTEEELKETRRSVGCFLPECYDYESLPWEDVLGAAVVPSNIERVGIDAVAAFLNACESFRTRPGRRPAQLENFRYAFRAQDL